MGVGCLEYPGASTIGSQHLGWSNAPMTDTTAQPSHEPPHKKKGTGTCYTENNSGEKPTKPRGGGGGGENGWQNLAWRKTECAKESHDWCNQLLGMCMPLKTADLMISKVHVSNICSDLLFIYIYLFIVCFFMFNSHCWRKQD